MPKSTFRKGAISICLLITVLALSGCFPKKILADDSLRAHIPKQISGNLAKNTIGQIVDQPMSVSDVWLMPSPTPVSSDLFDKVFGKAREMIPTIMPKPVTRTEKWGMITVPALNVRDIPSADGAIIAGLQQDQRFKIESEQEGWLQVVLDDGQTGWSSADYITVEELVISGNPTPEPTAPALASSGKGIILADSLNVRSMPNTGGSILASLTRYQCVDLVSEQDGWYQIAIAGAPSGWSTSEYIQTADECPPPGAPNPGVAGGSAPAADAVQRVDYVEPAKAEPYAAQPIKTNASVVQEVNMHECFGGGWDEIRFVSSNTPVEVLGTGPWTPPAGQENKLGPGPYLKIRIWDGQYGWIAASAVNVKAEYVDQISGTCDEGDRINWVSVERPTPRPTPRPRATSRPYPTRPPTHNPGTSNNFRPTPTPRPQEHKFRDE